MMARRCRPKSGLPHVWCLPAGRQVSRSPGLVFKEPCVKSSPRSLLLLGFVMVSVASGCCHHTLDVPQCTFGSPDDAFWSYRTAVRERDYAKVYSYLSVDQRETAGELFWWLQRYTENGKETLLRLGSIESLSPEDRLVCAFAFTGISPLHEESVGVPNLRRDDVRMKWDSSRLCYVCEYRYFPSMWTREDDIEVIVTGDGRYAIRLKFMWMRTDRKGSYLRWEMIEACQTAIRAQEGLVGKLNRGQSPI